MKRGFIGSYTLSLLPGLASNRHILSPQRFRIGFTILTFGQNPVQGTFLAIS